MADGNPGTPQSRAGGAGAEDSVGLGTPDVGPSTTLPTPDWRLVAFATAPAGVVLFDFTGRVLDANPAFADLVERRASQAREMNLLDIVAPHHLQATTERLDAAATGSCTSPSSTGRNANLNLR